MWGCVRCVAHIVKNMACSHFTSSQFSAQSFTVSIREVCVHLYQIEVTLWGDSQIRGHPLLLLWHHFSREVSHTMKHMLRKQVLIN